jgi:predicted transcriptional regulator
MAEILDRVRKLQEERKTLSEAQLKQLEEAQKLYKALNESAGKPPEAARVVVEGVIKNAANVLTVLGPVGAASCYAAD